MVLDLPTRVGRDVRQAGPERPLDLPVDISGVPVVDWVLRHRRMVILGILVSSVLGFSGAWTGGALVLDGPGISLYVRMALDHLGADRMVPYWMPDLWAGAPVWAVTPTLPVFLLVPLATVVGPDVAVKLGVLAVQVLGAVGAYVLARSLWRSVPAAVVAGVLFGLQPLLISHGALAGSQPTAAVMAAAPWLAWALRKGLRGDGWRYVALAGLLAGFAVLMQVEYAMGLALLCGCLLAVEAGRVRTGHSPAAPRQLVGRAAAVVAIGLGSVAYWLLPFLSLGRSFVLSPPQLVQGELFGGGAGRVAREFGVFFGPARELTGAVGFNRQDLLPLFFHLGWVCLALTLITVVFSPRDRDGTLTAILLASAVGVWLSTGVVPLASGGAAGRAQVVPFLVGGLVVGLLLGALLRTLSLGRLAPLFLGGAVAFMVAVPYMTPFVTLQDVLPFFDNLRFPRFYAVAPLALALGAAYPVVLVREWAESHRARSAPRSYSNALVGAVALAIVGLFLADVWPYRSAYRVRPPASADAYRTVTANLVGAPGDFRIAPTEIAPSAVSALLDAERPLSVGWPHFTASKQLWRLTAEPFLTPSAYRDRAYGLSSTAYQVIEKPTDPGTEAEAVPAIDLVSNPRFLPMVRAYTHTVAMAGRDITPELAVGLAHRNVGVFTGSPTASAALAATTVVDVRSSAPCDDDSGSRLDPALASQLGVACGLHAWLGTLFAGVDLLNIEKGVGAVFRSTTDRLQGISAYLDRAPDRADVTLHEVMPGDVALGPELARGKAVGIDENGFAAFTFDPVAGSAGKDYAFMLTCPDCPAAKVPRLVAGHSVDQPGNLLLDGALRRDRSAAFTPIYEPVAADPPTATTIQPTRLGPGRWRIQADGPQPALVVLAEAWFPGWKARVDGRRAPVVEADGGFVGVPVDAGSHVVTIEYRRPAAAALGRVLTGATMLILAVAAIRRRRAGQRPVAAAVVAGPPSRRAPTPAPLLPARIRPRTEPSRPDPRSPSPPRRPDPPLRRPSSVGAGVEPEAEPDQQERPSDEPDWDAVVTPGGRPPTSGPPPSPPLPRPAHPRPPGTARWPPEPR